MHEYDIALKLIFQQSVDLAIRDITGTTIAKWLNVELPEVRNTRVDSLGETDAGDLVHIEWQSTNDLKMALRMAEYYLRVYRLFSRFPQQILVYVGDAPMRMEAELRGPALSYSYRIVDIRDLNGERLLESPCVGDNIIAILTRLPDLRAAIHRILERIASLVPGEREGALRQLFILAGLRSLEKVVDEEARKMPILNDIRDNKVLGEDYKDGLRTALRLQIKERFGTIPSWAEERLSELSWVELEALAPRLLRANSLEDWLQ